ncbi:MAG: ArsR family transcriptional regulator [Candidatus Bathyarchaeota archaeon]|nr:ArsR family transcriptional regulator [Candidatus Bathyarchaeota archaeon]
MGKPKKLFNTTQILTIKQVPTIKRSLHPNAYLLHIKNIRKGLSARSKILNYLDSNQASASAIATKTRLSYGVVMHHLRLLETASAVKRKGTRPYIWLATGSGQTRL